MARNLVWSLLFVLVFSVGASEVARAGAATATVTPATGGNGVPVIFGHAEFDLGDVAYTREEFFIEGIADAYTPVGALTTDGKWTVAPFLPTNYKTRVIVNKPADPSQFSGTVVVEWFNVSGLVDSSPEWQHQHIEILRQGHAWVGVSAQWHGVRQLVCTMVTGQGTLCPGLGDLARYASLVHPGDSWSYDIYSQAGQAIRDQSALILGPGYQPERLIAVGESQSAGRLTTYIDAVHPLVEVYDGYILHSRGDDGSALSQSLAGRPPFSPPAALPTPDVATPIPSLIRDDLGAPVLAFQAENDLSGLVARQADSSIFRLWEVAGTAHFDTYGLIQAGTDTGDRSTVADWFDSMRNPSTNPNPQLPPCLVPINTGPATFVNRAALRAMDRWIGEGEEPPIADRLDLVSISPPIYNVDAQGNVLGGIRTPAVDAPVAQLNGLGQPPPIPIPGVPNFCFLFGVTQPLSDAELAALYGSHGGFVSDWMKATQSAVKAGFLLKEDAQDIRVVGAQSDILQ